MNRRAHLGPGWELGFFAASIICRSSRCRKKARALLYGAMAMSETQPITRTPTRVDRDAQDLIRELGRWTRRVREFLDFSQDKLAKLAGVSQGAISRVEAGRGIATPMVTFWKINQVFVKALGEIDASMLTDEARGMLERARYLSRPAPDHRPIHEQFEASEERTPFVLVDPVLARLISTYHSMPERDRPGFLKVLEAAASLSAPSSLATQASLSSPGAMIESPLQHAARTPN